MDESSGRGGDLGKSELIVAERLLDLLLVEDVLVLELSELLLLLKEDLSVRRTERAGAQLSLKELQLLQDGLSVACDDFLLLEDKGLLLNQSLLQHSQLFCLSSFLLFLETQLFGLRDQLLFFLADERLL